MISDLEADDEGNPIYKRRKRPNGRVSSIIAMIGLTITILSLINMAITTEVGDKIPYSDTFEKRFPMRVNFPQKDSLIWRLTEHKILHGQRQWTISMAIANSCIYFDGSTWENITNNDAREVIILFRTEYMGKQKIFQSSMPKVLCGARAREHQPVANYI